MTIFEKLMDFVSVLSDQSLKDLTDKIQEEIKKRDSYIVQKVPKEIIEKLQKMFRRIINLTQDDSPDTRLVKIRTIVSINYIVENLNVYAEVNVVDDDMKLTELLSNHMDKIKQSNSVKNKIISIQNKVNELDNQVKKVSKKYNTTENIVWNLIDIYGEW